MATSKRLTVIKTSPNSEYNYWGNQAVVASQQNWKPSMSGKDFTMYRQGYDSPFNDVLIPNTTEKGMIQVVGKRGNKMDIVITDKQGNIRHTINQNVSPEFVQDYITNNSSTIAQRMNRVNNFLAMNK